MHALTGNATHGCVQNAWHVSYGYVHHSFKAKHALLQEIDAHTLLQHVIDALEGLEAQAQKSAVGADEDTAKLQHVIDTLVKKRRPAERIDSLRAELVEAKAVCSRQRGGTANEQEL